MTKETYQFHSDWMWNPWRGEVVCPECHSKQWTMPHQPGEPLWRCVMCHVDFVTS